MTGAFLAASSPGPAHADSYVGDAVNYGTKTADNALVAAIAGTTYATAELQCVRMGFGNFFTCSGPPTDAFVLASTTVAWAVLADTVTFEGQTVAFVIYTCQSTCP